MNSRPAWDAEKAYFPPPPQKRTKTKMKNGWRLREKARLAQCRTASLWES